MTDTFTEGDAFPDFSMETPDGGTVTKADLAGSKAVIFFYGAVSTLAQPTAYWVHALTAMVRPPG